MTQRIRVWDLPTRLFHWMFALGFLVAYLTGESERWALLHVTAGYTVLGLIGFRLLWGLVGTRHARFSAFVTVSQYLSGSTQGRPQHYVGHNPAGALAILALLLLGLASGVSGWLVHEDIGGEWLEDAHESVSALMLAIVLVHIAGVLVSSRIHGENLVRSMLDGKKEGEASQAIASNRPLVACLLLAGLLGFWGWSFRGMDTLGLAGDGQSSAPSAKPDADEDDDR